MSVYFFDTCALQHRYVDGEFSRRIRKIITDRRNRCYIADVTIVEIAGTLARKCRGRKWDLAKYDAMDLKFLEDVAGGRLVVRPAKILELNRARHLIRLAGVIRRRSFGSADAVIAVSSLDLALEIKERVIFYTHDWALYSTLRDINAFKIALRLRFLGPGRGGIPPES